MTKSDIAEAIRTKVGIQRKDAENFLESVLQIMKDTLSSGEEVKISGFGKFAVRQKNDRRGRNPQTGDIITITSRKVLTFKPSVLLKDVLKK
jgi:integration host factor subunit alpha